MRAAPRHRPPSGFFFRGASGTLTARVDAREVGFDDDEFPDGLRTMDRPPERIWVAGRDLRTLGAMVTIIGARRATAYGVSVAHRLAGDLVTGGVCIVSGLARGCDAAAHDGALEAGGATVAVLGSGVNVCYPPGSRSLYAEIAAKGSIVSANPPGHAPHKHDFVYRNDMMVAMSVAVVITQGDKDSAAVKTGGRAAGRGRGNVFAVPGSIEWPQSEGVHELLKKHVSVCTNAQDIVDALRGELRWAPPVTATIPGHLPPEQQRVLAVLSDGPSGRESIIARSGLDPAAASAAVTLLELRGFVVEEGFLLRRAR